MSVNRTIIDKIHTALHDGNAASIEFKSHTLPINDTSMVGKDFRSLSIGNKILAITQNLGKFSENTDWVEEDIENRSITWFIEQGRGYIGRVKEWVEDDDSHIEYTAFKRGDSEEQTFRDEDYYKFTQVQSGESERTTR